MLLTKKITRITLAVLSIALLFASGLTSRADAITTTNVVAASKDDVCNGIGGCTNKPGESTPETTVVTVINLLSFAVATVSVIMVIIGGFKYVTSQGDSSGTASARNTIVYALVGLVVVAVAQVMVRFVTRRVTG